MSDLLACWLCGADLSNVPRPISRHATCDACFNELHCCRMCRHYDPQKTMQCFEDRADPPLQKENANFCDFFSPSPNAFTPGNTDRSSAAKDALNDLFAADTPEANSSELDTAVEQHPDESDSKPLSAEEQARQKLDDLFKS